MPERILKILSTFNMTQGQLAACVGLRQTAVSRYITGETEIPQSTAMAFQAALGVRWQWTLKGEGEMRLSKAEYLPDDLKELADLWPRLSEGDRQYVLGLAEGRVAAKGKK